MENASNVFSWCAVYTVHPMLQPLRWRCVERAIHHERDVREEQYPDICGANKQQ